MSSRSINKVTLLGNLTRDPELKYTPAGTAVCTFGVATNRSWTTADGQLKEEAQYHRIVSWQKLAELCNKLLVKGRKVYLEGRITYREFVDKAGQQRNITEIVMDDFIVFYDSPRKQSDEKLDKSVDTDEKETVESKPKQEENESREEESSEVESKSGDVNPDDIPF